MNDVTKDLLEALKDCERVIDILWVSHHANRADAALEKARAAIARAEASLDTPQPDADTLWKTAVIDQLVIAHILTAEHESDPRKAIQDLLAYNSEIAVDPRVSDAAALLAEQARAEEREACAKLCDPAPGVKYSPNTLSAMISCAFAIRARGQK